MRSGVDQPKVSRSPDVHLWRALWRAPGNRRGWQDRSNNSPSTTSARAPRLSGLCDRGRNHARDRAAPAHPQSADHAVAGDRTATERRRGALSITRRMALELLLCYLRTMRGHTLPPAITLDPRIRPSVLTALICALVLRLVRIAPCDDRRVTVQADLYIVVRCRGAFPLA